MNLKTAIGFVVMLVWLPNLQATAQTDTDNAVQRSAQRTQDQQTYLLQYKMNKGETLRWSVEQIATTDASIAGFDEESSMKTRSVIAWHVLSVDDKGQITIQDKLESAVEWQKTGDADPISYDSSKDQETPDIYRATAEKIGKAISTTTIAPSGKIVQQESHIPTMEIGMGKFTMQFPNNPLPIGAQWITKESLQARRSDQTLKTIQTRMLYTLRKVENGLATISFRREILTPIDDPTIKSQLQQKMNQGSMLFDIAKGRVTRKLVQWDEKVLGWAGDDSFLHYVAKYTMELLDEEVTTAESSTTPSTEGRPGSLSPLRPKAAKQGDRTGNYIRPRKGKPIIRK